MSNSKGLCRVALMPRNLDLPPDFLLAGVNEMALKRARSFTNDNRRADFLWGRVLLAHLAQSIDPKTVLSERAPKTPEIAGSSIALFSTISHTRTWVGAAVSDCPVAIDLEVMAPDRAKPAIFNRVFGDGAWQKYASQDPVGLFYRTWGLYECAVKLEGKLQGEADSAQVVLNEKACIHYFFRLPQNTLLTVVGHFERVSLEAFEIKDRGASLIPYSDASALSLISLLS